MQPFDSLSRLEELDQLDPAISGVQRVVRALLPPGPLRDGLHGVWLGHPFHPALVLTPVGCFIGAGVLDALPGAEREADVLVATGLAAVPMAAVAGWADWSELHEQQMRTGIVHAATNLAGTALYAASLVARGTGRRGLGRALGWLGLGTVTVGGMIGGHLGYRQAAGANHAEQVPHRVSPGWHPVGRLADLPEAEPVRRDAGDEPVVAVRRGDRVSVLAATCSHLSGPLHDGELTDVGGRDCLVCPWHGSTFDLADGAVVHGPATGRQPVFEVEVVDGEVRVRLPGAG